MAACLCLWLMTNLFELSFLPRRLITPAHTCVARHRAEELTTRYMMLHLSNHIYNIKELNITHYPQAPASSSQHQIPSVPQVTIYSIPFYFLINETVCLYKTKKLIKRCLVGTVDSYHSLMEFSIAFKSYLSGVHSSPIYNECQIKASKGSGSWEEGNIKMIPTAPNNLQSYLTSKPAFLFGLGYAHIYTFKVKSKALSYNLKTWT